MSAELLNKVIAYYKARGYTDFEVVEDWLIIRRGHWKRLEGFAGILKDKDWWNDTFREN